VGTSSHKIVFSGGGGGLGAILFNRLSPSWSEETGQGSILQQVIINSSIAIGIGDTSPKIDTCQVNGSIIASDYDSWGNPLRSSSPIITNNVIVGSSYGTVMQISTSPIIENNTIKGSIQTYGGSSFIRWNKINGSIDASGSEYIADNTIIGKGDGYGIQTGGSPLIERNSIRNFTDGIKLWYNHPSPTVRNNTIENCTDGLSVPGLYDVYPNPQIYYNNFADNSQYNIDLFHWERDSKYNINATYNYWGTTENNTISHKIHDYKKDFNLGNVTYEPFLTAPNPQAMPNIEAPLSTSNPSPTPTSTPSATPNVTVTSPSPSPTVPELSWLIIVPLFVATLFIAIKIRQWKNNRVSICQL
jgi:parallel beta-helix repeat protein